MTKTAVVFPGAGSQQFGMEQSLISHFPASQKLYQQASELLNQDILKFCADQTAYRTDQSLAAVTLLIFDYAYFQQLQQRHSADYILGLSSGQIAGALASGMLTFSMAVQLCYDFTKIGELLDQTESGLLISNGLAVNKVQAIIQQADFKSYLATVNSPINVVLGAETSNLTTLSQQLKCAGADVVKITNMPAFHTPLVSGLLPAMRRRIQARDVPLTPGTISFLSDYDNQWNHPADFHKKLIYQDVAPSNLAENIRKIRQLGVDQIWSIAPGHRLTDLIKANFPSGCEDCPTVHVIKELS